MAYRLRALGGLALEGPERPPDGAATRRRSLALLAILAAAGESGVPRDKLLLYLWPESNTQRARNSLHQTLYAIRRHLGQDAILVGIPNLQLNPALFSCDLWEFEAALARRAAEEAIAVYGGQFLDGFTLPELPEFEQWMEEQRARLARRYAEALEASALQAAEEGRHRLTIERWQALARLEPLSARPALGTIRALGAAGDRAGALEYARHYQEVIQRELGTGPDPDVTALVEQLRARRSWGGIGLPLSSEPPLPDSAKPEIAAETEPVGARQARRATPATVWKLIVAVLVLIDVAALATLWWTRRGAPPPPATFNLIAVFPFAVEGSPQVQYLGTGLVDLLSANLEGAGGLRSVDPNALLGSVAEGGAPIRTLVEARVAAARFGAGRVLLGSVVESGGRLHLRAALYDHDRGDEPVARAAVQGEASNLFDLVDRLTTELLAQGRHDPSERLARVAATTTSSLDALKSHLIGERELRAGRYGAAGEAFRAAVTSDTGFALAYYRLSIAAEWMGQDSLARLAADSALHFGGRLSEHDRLLVQALAARRSGNWDDAERLYREVVDHHPDDVEAHLQLGQLLFQINPLRARSAAESRPAFERVLALDPSNEEALVHLARIASIEGRRAGMDTLMRRLLALGSSAEVLETRAFRAFALGDRDAWKRVTRELMESPPDVPPVTALQVATYLDDLDGAERFARLLTAERYSDQVRGMAYRLLARVAAARGRWSVARVQLDTARRYDSTAEVELRSLLAVLPFLQVSRSELADIRREVQEWQARIEGPGEVSHSAAHAGLHPYVRLYRLGLLDVSLGDTATALRTAAALQRAAGPASALKANALHTFARSIRARVAAAGGRPADALHHLEQAEWGLVESIFEAEALDRYQRAELLYAVGRHQEALGWYRTIAERATYELVYVAPARWRQAEVYQRAGDRARAAEAYRTVARLWRDADPPLRAIAAEAARRLGSLAPSRAGASGTVR